MKALVYQAPGKMALEDRPTPGITSPTDAVVKILRTTICGTDLHILKGDVPTCPPGRILGHEGVGVVETVGAAVTAFRSGDHVIVSCISSCGKCDYCRKGCTRTASTAVGFWATPSTHTGGIRADALRRHQPLSHPGGADEEALVMLSDICPPASSAGF